MTSGLPLGRATLAGAVLGAGWGVLARVFMHFLSDDPQFTWGGTLLILGLSALLGAGLGSVHGARTSRRRRWWRLAPIPGMVLFGGPGLLLLPAFAGGLVAGPLPSRWWRALARAVGLLVSIGTLVFLSFGADPSDPAPLDPPSPLAVVPGIVLFVAAAALLGLGASIWTRRWPASADEADRMPAGAVSEAPGGEPHVDARR